MSATEIIGALLILGATIALANIVANWAARN